MFGDFMHVEIGINYFVVQIIMKIYRFHLGMPESSGKSKQKYANNNL